MTGLLGGGHAVYLDARDGSIRNLDCFVAVPSGDAGELLRLQVPFGAELVHYAVGPASCGVPGVPAGLDALWRAAGRLPWARLVEPALRLAAAGVELPPAHAACLAMLEPVMTMNRGAALYAPGGTLLAAGETLRQPGLVEALRILAERVVALVDALEPGGPESHTTNLVTVDAQGSACVLTTSLGLGSGDFLPGLDLHLNSMLGELDLVREPLRPGGRMQSMMAPTLVLNAEGLVLAAGAARGDPPRNPA